MNLIKKFTTGHIKYFLTSIDLNDSHTKQLLGEIYMNLIKGKEKVEDYFFQIKENGYKPKNSYQNISITDIEYLLKKMGRYTDDRRDVICCLLNNELPNLYSKISKQQSISAGASVAHIGSYIGILLREKNKLDREGRDYWLKPLIEIGVIEQITLTPDGNFTPGHIRAKSPNSAYRLNKDFISLLQKSKDEEFDIIVKEWFSSAEERSRLIVSFESSESKSNHNPHKGLIEDSINIYAKNYLSGYQCVFKDADDGNRITQEELSNLAKFKIAFGSLEDVWPDAILYNIEKDSLWFIEAVTSDGEADIHKLKGFKKICEKSNKKFGGCTTTYNNWKKFAERQKTNNNLAQGTFVWIKECPEKQLLIQ